MDEEVGRDGPEWANQMITNLAKIHSTFDNGQRIIQSFVKEHKIIKPDFGFDQFNDIGASAKR